MEGQQIPRERTLTLPVAIVVAGALIAGALLIVNTDLSARPSVPPDIFEGGGSLQDVLRPVTEDDWVAGNKEGSVTVIEYSDAECPFCASFHPTMERIVSEFPEVRWVYRHFPLTSIHSNAFSAAVAGECVGALKGDAAFFSFMRTILMSQRNLGDIFYETEASKLGVASDAFRTCVKDPLHTDAVDADLGEAIAAGGTGTPFSIVISKSGRYFPINGALGYSQVSAIIKAARQ